MVTKKDFFKSKPKTAHPAEAFITKPEVKTEPAPVVAPAPTPVVEPAPVVAPTPAPASDAREMKTRRLYLLTTPSLQQAMKAKATEMGLSFNEACNLAMIEFLKQK